MDAESELTQTTLCFPVAGEPITSVLLGYKKQGFGAGKYTGFGGKVEPDETPLAAAVRELREETGLATTPVDTSAAGLLTFRFPHRPAWSQQVHLFITRSWTGQMAESDEMRPVGSPLMASPTTGCGRMAATGCPISSPVSSSGPSSPLPPTTRL